MAAGFGRGRVRASALAIGVLTSHPALAAQGVAVADGTATPVEQALVIAFILSLPVTLLLIGLSRGR